MSVRISENWVMVEEREKERGEDWGMVYRQEERKFTLDFKQKAHIKFPGKLITKESSG